MDEGQGSRSQPIERLPVKIAWIERLPVELVCMVLSALPDVMSLQAAVLSCPLFYTAFLPSETSITTSVLLNQVDIRVLPDAIAALESSLLQPSDIENHYPILNFLIEIMHQRPTLPTSWSLKTALRLGRPHGYVEQVTKRFIEMALADKSGPDATPQEEYRIQRALYTFEVYCNLSGPMKTAESIDREALNRLFFADFTSPEDERLAYMDDFPLRYTGPRESLPIYCKQQ